MPTGTQAQTAPQPTAQLTKVFVATDYAGYGSSIIRLNGCYIATTSQCGRFAEDRGLL